MSANDNDQSKKAKFTFNCTKCGSCCENRGPIPLTFWDLELWASKNVVSNFLPYLKIYKNPRGFFDLVLSPLKFNELSVEEEKSDDKNLDPDFKRCPLYNIEKKKCLVYDFRPLSCRTYPLEFDGEKYNIVDLDCPGIDQGEMTKEQRIEMRDNAKNMNRQLVTMRTSLPVLQQAIQQDFIIQMMKQQQEAMKNMDPEDLKKLNELLSKKQE